MGGAAMHGESVPSDRPSLANSQRSGDEAAPFASLPHVRWDPCHPARSLRCRSARCSCVLTHSARASHLELRSRCYEAAPFASLPHVRTSWRPCAMIHVQCTLVNEQCTRKQGDVPPLRCITLLAHCTLLCKEAGRCAALRTDSASHSLHHDSLCKEARTRATRFAHCVTVLANITLLYEEARTRATRYAHCVTVLAFIIIVLWAGSRNASDNEHCHIGH
jgi:hypothetical protein